MNINRVAHTHTHTHNNRIVYCGRCHKIIEHKTKTMRKKMTVQQLQSV